MQLQEQGTTRFLISDGQHYQWMNQTEVTKHSQELVLRAYFPQKDESISQEEKSLAIAELNVGYIDQLNEILSLSEIANIPLNIEVVEEVTPAEFDPNYIYTLSVLVPYLRTAAEGTCQTYYLHTVEDCLVKANKGTPVQELFFWSDVPVEGRYKCIAKGVALREEGSTSEEQGSLPQMLYADVLQVAQPYKLGLILEYLESQDIVFDLMSHIDKKPFTKDDLFEISLCLITAAQGTQDRQDFKHRLAI